MGHCVHPDSPVPESIQKRKRKSLSHSEWVAFPFSRGFSQPRDQTQVSRIAGGFFTSLATRYSRTRLILKSLSPFFKIIF